MDFSKLQLKDIAISAKGAKSAAAVLENGEKLVWTCPEKVMTPWGATNFGDEQQVRRTIEFSLSTPALQDWFKCFDTWAVKYLAANSERLFKKQLTEKQVGEVYRSPMSAREGYAPTWRCKISPSSCRFWNDAGMLMEMPELRGRQCRPKAQLSHLWCMNKEIGFVWNVTDLQVSEEDLSCPFAGG